MTHRNTDRREGPDLWIKLLTGSGLLSGVSLVAALFVTARAKPEVETFFDRFYDLRLQKSWDLELMEYICYLLLICLFSSLGGLLINSRRKRRKADHIWSSLIFMSCVSVFGLLAYSILISHQG
ncbi:hypothetical protein [Geopsychrobacter electrodiphilus]|uniref:hypothetical protein n=1 Tax=Geopsychrobacter electrodiphilus TaxID=225196 RepID=UPI000367177F|nr:hypothetical protein [Geopsychrobacter electrodiphilus]